MATALIQERGTVSGNQMRMQRLPEDAAQTFLSGTPVQLSATGYVQVMITAATALLGITKEFGSGLTTAGAPLGRPANTANMMPPMGGGPTWPAQGGAVPNQPLARVFTRPVFNDGRIGVVLAIPDTVFYGQVGPAAAAPTQALVGTSAGLTIDTDGHWYVTPGATQLLVKIIGLDNWDRARGVLFTFLPSVGQLQA